MAEAKGGPGKFRRKPERKLNDLPFMEASLTVSIKTGKVLWDSISEDMGHVYDPSCYDQEGNRIRKQGEQVAFGIRTSQVDQRIEFDNESYCESCFQHGHGLKELHVKHNKIYCRSCGIGRPLKHG